MGKRNDPTVHIKVLQNGFPIAEAKKKLSKLKVLSLSSKHDGELSIPLYPLPNDIPLLKPGKSHAILMIDYPWTGFVTSSGLVVTINPKDRSEKEYRLDTGDYASIQLDDLRVMIKILQSDTKESKVKTNRSYYDGLTNLFFPTAHEKKAIILAALLSITVWVIVILIAQNTQIKRPESFEELAESYTLPFIHEESLLTSPEALQGNLDRSGYINSVVAFYKNTTLSLIGHEVDQPKYLFDSTINRHKKQYESYYQKIESYQQEQDEIDSHQLSQGQLGILSVPSAYGESFSQKLVRIIKKIDTIHKNFHLSLNYRRIFTTQFKNDPSYNWTEYNNEAKGQGLLDPELNPNLKKISVFEQSSDESIMYEEARLLAQKAISLQESQLKNQSAHAKLNQDSAKAILIPSGVHYISFSHVSNLETGNSKISDLNSTIFDPNRRKFKKEPFIGKINPKKIQWAIRNKRIELHLCYEQALRRNQNLQGQMHWSWDIDRRGQISNIILAKSSLQDRQMINCVRRRMAAWSFPKPRKGSIKVTHTFNFIPQKG